MGALDDRWRRELDELRAAGRYRELRAATGHDFTSNDYLGYAKLPSLEEPKLSTSGAASRLLRGHHALWTMVETRLAGWHQSEAALVFTSGYVANEGLLGTIIGPDDYVVSDACNHASIIDGLRLSKAKRFVYAHNDLSHLRNGLRIAGDRQKFIVTESLFSMEGDVAPLKEIAALAEFYGASLIVDEAHATGCFGSAGSGLVDSLGLRSRVLATVHTGGKALGVPGAYVAGSKLLREFLVNRCRHLVFTTALPPLVAWWWTGAIDNAHDDDAGRSRLHSNAATFRKALERRGVPAGARDYIVPIILGGDARAVAVAERLQAAGFDVRAIRPPTVPAGTARLRISIHADHPPALLEALAEQIALAVRATA
jgi:8-amino-7-oxononanoate synthase